MGLYLNPGDESFRTIRNDVYIDKSGMIEWINDTIDTPRKLTCVSRPRRFGKSFASKMLCAYYDRTCNSECLFDDLEIAKKKSYHQYRNRFDVLYLDMTNILGESGDCKNILSFVKKTVTKELAKFYEDVKEEDSFTGVLLRTVEHSGTKFVCIIDEWDVIFREAREDTRLQQDYIDFLRSLFKSSGTTDRIFAAVYMTGILPIKKYGHQSAVSDFQEYTMTDPAEFAEYAGFTDKEVYRLCEQYSMDYEEMRHWYDGYSFGGEMSIYNPNSVIMSIRRKSYDSYWTRTETYKTLKTYIDMDLDGLQQEILQLIGGASVPVNIGTFQNDMISMNGKDDVLTLLIHLGYLAYDRKKKTVYIPNEEIRQEFVNSVRMSKYSETAKLIQGSWKLLQDTE